MKKTMIFAAALILLAGTASNAGAQDVKDILNKMIDAQGGRKALESIADSTTLGTLEMIQMGMSGSIAIYQKYPNKMRIDVEIMGMTMTQAFDGEKAWMTNMQTGAVEEMPDLMAKNMRRQALGARAALHPEQVGITYVFKGREKVNDKEYIVLVQSFKDEFKATVYVDPTTYLVYKVRAKSMDATGMGGEVETETVYGEYKKEGDTLAAHTISTFQNGAEALRMTLTKISYNSKLEDAFFNMPKSPTD
jgi:outer membrane lipoprotein-sorting protein